MVKSINEPFQGYNQVNFYRNPSCEYLSHESQHITTYNFLCCNSSKSQNEQLQPTTSSSIADSALSPSIVQHHFTPDFWYNTVWDNTACAQHSTPCIQDNAPCARDNIPCVHHNSPCVQDNTLCVQDSTPCFWDNTPCVQDSSAQNNVPCVQHSSSCAQDNSPCVQHSTPAMQCSEVEQTLSLDRLEVNVTFNSHQSAYNCWN